MPRELIGYELIIDTNDSDRVKKVLMWTIKHLIITIKCKTETVGDDKNVWQENNKISIVISFAEIFVILDAILTFLVLFSNVQR